jgi:hypothetical protein
MKEHFCSVEKSMITYQGKCNWCGEQEALAQMQEPVCKYNIALARLVQLMRDKRHTAHA